MACVAEGIWQLEHSLHAYASMGRRWHLIPSFESLQNELKLQVDTSALSLDSSCIKVHPDGRRLKKRKTLDRQNTRRPGTPGCEFALPCGRSWSAKAVTAFLAFNSYNVLFKYTLCDRREWHAPVALMLSKGHLNDGPQGRILLRKLDGQFNGLMWPRACRVKSQHQRQVKIL